MSDVLKRSECPVCLAEGKDSDRNNLTHFKNGKVSCAAHQGDVDHYHKIIALRPDLASNQSDSIIAEYSYQDASGKELYQAVRKESKAFLVRHKVNGRWVWKIDGINRVLYRLPKIASASEVWICEGEKDVHTLESCGIVATTSICGAGDKKNFYNRGYPETLRGKDIVLCGDNDAEGEAYLQAVLAAVLPVAKSVRRVRVPAPHKDVSDLVKAIGVDQTALSLGELLSQSPILERELGIDEIEFKNGEPTTGPAAVVAEPEGSPLRGVSLCDIVCDVHHDPDELLKRRFLSRGGGAMLFGPTGIGKSSFKMQAAILWALGKPFFGIEPPRPLASLIIQAENDDGDLIEMREGMFAGLDLSEEEKNQVRERVIIYSENSKTGATFISGVLLPLLREHRPDLVWLDNLFAYCGCSVSDQEKMSLFLRNLINPLIQEYRCGIIIGHHTNKPPTGEQKADWSVSETSYLGSGSSELANWPRAILSIRALKTQGVFELVAGKRGPRLGWKDAEGKTTCRRNIGHSTDGLIYWRDADADEVPAKAGKKQKHFVEDILRLLGEKHLGASAWQKLCYQEKGVPSSTFYELKAEAEKSKRIAQDDADKWFKVV